MDFSTLAVFCEHRYLENGHEMPWGRAAKHTFNGICRGFCTPSFPFFSDKNCLYPQFFSSVVNSWNKSLSTLFFLQTYWYAWLNNCGLGRPLMRVFTRPQMKPLHHVHSLSTCCVPANLLCPRCFFPRIWRVNSERQCLTCSIFKGCRKFFAALSQLRHPSVKHWDFFRTLVNNLLAKTLRRGAQVSMELSRSKSHWCHLVTFLARECSTESRVAAAFLDVSLSTLWSGPWRWPNPFWPGIFSRKLRPVLPAALNFVRSDWKCIGLIFAIKSVVNDQCDMKNLYKCSKNTDSIEVYV